jgi:DNA polymerase iota
MSYNYYNLSSDDSGRGDLDSEESEQEEMNNDSRLVFQDKTKSQAGLWDRIICHLDVDCFYCQCEEIDGPPHYKERPLAIGQKHIIVTSNYVARKYGVKKLQSRDAAYAACPNLLILEGSDLEHYRKYSRKIYLAFREKVSQIAQQVGATVHVRKGGLDENFCDLTDLVNKSLKQEKPKNLFVYGESPTVTSAIVEDQSGARAIVQHNLNVHSGESVHLDQNVDDQRDCQDRLHTAAALCEQIRHYVKEQTGFTSTMGVSVSKMLAKLSSDLNKPNSINVLYPWRSASVILPMPLRKIPDLGHASLKSLADCLKSHHLREPKFWTCR